MEQQLLFPKPYIRAVKKTLAEKRRVKMKRIKLEKVNTNSFFLTPVIGFTKFNRWEEYRIEYRLCFAWFRFHASILLYVKSDD